MDESHRILRNQQVIVGNQDLIVRLLKMIIRNQVLIFKKIESSAQPEAEKSAEFVLVEASDEAALGLSK